jgi:hypothetical protein
MQREVLDAAPVAVLNRCCTVVDHGTGAGASDDGFHFSPRRKDGTTDDLRRLVRGLPPRPGRVWVGYDQPRTIGEE